MGQPTTTPPGPGNWHWDDRKDQWVALTPEQADAHSAAQAAADGTASAPVADAAPAADVRGSTTFNPQE